MSEVKSAINETAPLIGALRNLVSDGKVRPTNTRARTPAGEMDGGFFSCLEAPWVLCSHSSLLSASGIRSIGIFHSVDGVFPRQAKNGNKTYELEARLGFVQDGRGQGGSGEEKARFDNGVSREFMDRVLDLCEEWGDWTSLSGWSEMHDLIFRVGSTQMRTTVSYDASLDEGVRKTVKKRIVGLKDFSYVSTLGGVPRTGMLSADVRIALSEETVVDEESLPEWGKTRRPLRVRIKQRRSFNYTPEGATKPVWRFDFTLVWSAVIPGPYPPLPFPPPASPLSPPP